MPPKTSQGIALNIARHGVDTKLVGRWCDVAIAIAIEINIPPHTHT